LASGHNNAGHNEEALNYWYCFICMSRSLHTQKYSCRAERRLARSTSRRSSEALLLNGRGAKQPPQASSQLSVQLVRPQLGFFHPVRPSEIRCFLSLIGPQAIYGLRAITLHGESPWKDQNILLGEYRLPGEIILYAVPNAPWKLDFLPANEDLKAFQRHCREIQIDTRLQQVTLHWQPEELRRFYLFEVLAHELGHHLKQYRSGKPSQPCCRLSEHEIWAELFRLRVSQLLGNA
jgi:hypothetical protein